MFTYYEVYNKKGELVSVYDFKYMAYNKAKEIKGYYKKVAEEFPQL